MPRPSRLPALQAAAFVIPLLVGVLLIAAIASSEFFSRKAHYAAIACCIAWIAAGILMLALSVRRRRVPAFAARLLLLQYAVLISVGAAELALRLREGPNIGYYKPGVRRGPESNPAIKPGVFGRPTFTINEWGVRGPSIRALENKRPNYTILAIGGSTTICNALDDSEAWPQLLMDQLNAGQKERFVFAGNVGENAHTTAEHIVFVETLPVVRKADVLIFLVGVNDMSVAIQFEGRSTKRELDIRSRTAWPGIYRSRRAGLQASKTIELLSEASHAARIEGEYEERLKSMRSSRARSPKVGLPPLEQNLDEYRERLVRLISLCGELGKRCVFLTQPAMWRADLPEDMERLTWFGWIESRSKPRGYVSTAELAIGMDGYNRALLSVCAEKGAECYDLAAAIPKDTSAFYDDCHLNEGGARKVADFLARNLLNRPLAELSRPPLVAAVR